MDANGTAYLPQCPAPYELEDDVVALPVGKKAGNNALHRLPIDKLLRCWSLPAHASPFMQHIKSIFQSLWCQPSKHHHPTHGVLRPLFRCHKQLCGSETKTAGELVAGLAEVQREMNASKQIAESCCTSSNNDDSNVTPGASSSSSPSSSTTMAPPAPQPAMAAKAAVPREQKTRKGTPHPKPKSQPKRVRSACAGVSRNSPGQQSRSHVLGCHVSIVPSSSKIMSIVSNVASC